MKQMYQSLDGVWSWKAATEETEHTGRVPGSVLKDMLDGGLIEDPFWRENEYAARDLFWQDYIYSRSFQVKKELLDCEQIDLVFEGLDTLAHITVNGNHIADTDDMHRTWILPVKNQLREGENQIEIKFDSPLRFIHEEDEHNDIFYHSTGSLPGTAALRKAHCMFGWDWGPQLPDAGIFRSAYLRGITGARIADVRIRQRHEADCVYLTVSGQMDWTSGHEDATVAVTLISPDNTIQTSTAVAGPKGKQEEWALFSIEHPLLWWPNGWGKQYLYTVKVELRQAGTTIERRSYRIGLRTIKLCTENDAWGSEFAFQINGQKIFAMGANFIPQDSLISRVTPERSEALIKDCARANFNMIRVWGGGYYQDDAFYDACDRYGILVWHDLMFSCNVYRLDEDGKFESNIIAETKDNVRRIRHHACLALWCGNNEMESGWAGWKRLEGHHPRYPRDYLIIFERILNRVIAECDEDTPWWPSSPSSGGSFYLTSSPDHGDQHYWDVWHSGKPFTAYREEHFRFCSEYGFQSFPDMKTIRAFSLPEDRNIFSRVMESHQKNGTANSKIFTYVADYFRYPKNMDQIAYISQLLQLKAIQYGVEFWRQNRGRCMGSLYWQLNDCWPVASWASIDYYGRWKALHYGARRFYAPRMASCFEKEELSTDLTWYMHNDSREPYAGHLDVYLRNDRFEILTHLETDAEVAPLTVQPVLHTDFRDFLTDQTILKHSFAEYRLTVEGRVISRGTTLFVKPKHFELPEVHYKKEIKKQDGRFIIHIQADGFSYYTALGFDQWDPVFSDNYFDITSSEGVTVTVDEADLPKGITAADLLEALNIRSVRDSYLIWED